MNVYVAAVFEKRQEVRDVYARLRERGHTIAEDWTQHQPVKPYDQNAERSCAYAMADITAARSCDVFILLSDAAGTGMYIELGAAISSHLERGMPRVYVIGDHAARSLFYFHPSVARRQTLDEVLDEINAGAE